MYDIKKGMPNVLILRKWIAHSHFFKSIILFLVYTTQVKSDFHTCWLASSEVNNKYYSPLSSPRDKIAHHEFNSQPSFSILKEINWHVLIYLCGIFWIAIIPPSCQWKWYIFIELQSSKVNITLAYSLPLGWITVLLIFLWS